MLWIISVTVGWTLTEIKYSYMYKKTIFVSKFYGVIVIEKQQKMNSESSATESTVSLIVSLSYHF